MEQHDRERLDSVIAAVNDLAARVNGMVQADVAVVEEAIDYVALEEGVKAVRSHANLLAGRVEETMAVISRLGTRLEMLESQVTVVPQHSHDAHTHVEHAHREHTHSDIVGSLNEEHHAVTQLREDLRLAWQSLAKINERIASAEVGWRELINNHTVASHLSADHPHYELHQAIVALTGVTESLSQAVVAGLSDLRVEFRNELGSQVGGLQSQLTQLETVWREDLDELAAITADKAHVHTLASNDEVRYDDLLESLQSQVDALEQESRRAGVAKND